MFDEVGISTFGSPDLLDEGIVLPWKCNGNMTVHLEGKNSKVLGKAWRITLSFINRPFDTNG